MSPRTPRFYGVSFGMNRQGAKDAKILRGMDDAFDATSERRYVEIDKKSKSTAGGF